MALLGLVPGQFSTNLLIIPGGPCCALSHHWGWGRRSLTSLPSSEVLYGFHPNSGSPDSSHTENIMTTCFNHLGKQELTMSFNDEMTSFIQICKYALLPCLIINFSFSSGVCKFSKCHSPPVRNSPTWICVDFPVVF